MRSKQYLCAIRPEGRRPRAVDDGLRRRGERPRRDRRDRRPRGRHAHQEGAGHGAPAHRLARPTTSTPTASRTRTATRCSTSSSARPRARPRSSPRRRSMSEDKVVDLMAALEASVKEAKAARKRHPAGLAGGGGRGRAGQEAHAQVGVAAVPDQVVEIGGRQLKVSNLDKVLYPETGFTKAEVIDYYVRVAPVMLPHIADRGVTLRRYPERCRRDVVLREALPLPPTGVDRHLRRARRPQRHHRLLRARLGAPRWPGRPTWPPSRSTPRWRAAPTSSRPPCACSTSTPGPGTGIPECAEVALDIRGVLDRLAGLECLAKTSGSKGLQVYVPLNTPHTHEHCSEFAQAVAQVLEKHHADAGHLGHGEGASARARSSSTGARTAATRRPSPSTRSVPGPHPTVSTPVTWDEVEARRRRRRRSPSRPPTCSPGSTSTATSSRATLTTQQQLPAPHG